MKTKLVPFNIETAQAGAKIVTRCGRRVRIGFFDLKDEEHPIVGAVETDDGEVVCSFTKDGRRAVEDEESRNDAFKNVFDLFIEEEVEEEPNNSEIMPDKWYVCHLTSCFSEKEIGGRTWIYKGTSYLGTDILKLNLDFASENYEDYFHPWSIQDAKPGDILASKNGTNILIFKQIETITSFSSYYNIQHRRDDCWANDCFIPATKEQCSQIFKKMKEDGYEWDSINKELKRIDDKTKFKVGDWIVQDNAGIYKVTEICESWYEVVDSAELHYSIDFDQESMCHLWSIQEAKPGDVLAIDWKGNEHGYDWQKIVIFKSLNEFGVEGYGNTFKNNELAFEDEVPFYSKTWSRFLHPATKEQRDILFQKIKEEGYEWDSNKKELHKIGKTKTRRMTNRELAWWLRKCPEECREYKYKGCSNIHNTYNYYEDEADNPCLDVLIRSNGGEWKEPLV